MIPTPLSTCAAALLAAGTLTLSAHAATAAASPPAASAPANAAAAGDIYDIRPPIHLPAHVPWLPWTAGAAGAAALGYGAWRLSHRPRREQAWELALEKLEATRPLMAEENAQPFSLAVSEIVRGFIEQSCPLRAAHRTTQEFLSDVANRKESPLSEHREALRVTGGKNPLALGANNSGKGVGGGTVHWAAFTPRFHPSDFEVCTRDGLGADWPISYWDLKPYYELLELEMPVAGPAWFPWGDPHGYAFGPASDRGRREFAHPWLLGARHSGQRGRAHGDPQRLARQPAALHLPWLLHSGMQGRREGEHAHHACAGCDRKRRGDPRSLHGRAHPS